MFCITILYKERKSSRKNLPRNHTMHIKKYVFEFENAFFYPEKYASKYVQNIKYI